MKRLAVVFNNQAPYFRARLRALGAVLPLVAMPLHLKEEAWEKRHDLPDPFTLRPLVADHEEVQVGRIVHAVQRALNEERPDVVAVHGWSRRCSLAALSWCSRHRVPAVLLSDFQALHRPRTTVADSIKQRLLSCCSAILTAGRAHVDLLHRWGVPRERIRTGYAVVDNRHFTEGAADARRIASSYRKRLELPLNYFLCISRLVKEKNLPFLLGAYHQYWKQTRKAAWKLVIAGEGPEHNAISILAHQLGLREHVLLVGTYNYRVLPALYGMARALILASTREPWGLAVNEAMASGLPVFVSDHVSCAPDLVRSGENGQLFDAHAPEGLTAHMLAATRGEYDLSVMGRASLGLISEWTPELFALRMREAVQIALASPVKPSRWDASLAGILARRPRAPA